MPDADATSIARGLSAAQKRYLLGDVRSIGNPRVLFVHGVEACGRKTLPTRTVLTRLGLLENGRFGPTMLTPLGVAVRAVLQAEAANGE